MLHKNIANTELKIKTINYGELNTSKQILIKEMKSMGFIRLQFENDIDFEKILTACKDFFELDENLKLQLLKNTTDRTYFGYFPSSLHGKEGLDIPNINLEYDHILTNQIKFPFEYESKHKKCVYEYLTFVYKIGLDILNILNCDTLNLFDDFKNLSMLRFNYYPPHDKNDIPVSFGENNVKLACETHVDNTLLTILCQDDCGGLQIQNPNTKEWIDVEYVKNSLIINTGKILSFMTNNEYIPVNHRVLLNTKERISVPYFMCPNIDSVLKNDVKYLDFLLSTMVNFKEYQHIANKLK